MEAREKTNINTNMVDRQNGRSGEKLEEEIARKVRVCLPTLVEGSVAMVEMRYFLSDAQLRFGTLQTRLCK